MEWTYTSFEGIRRIATGNLSTNVLAVKHAIDSSTPYAVMTFCDQTGQTIEVDTRGSEAEALARLPSAAPSSPHSESTVTTRSRGRPKLGVVAREVTLLPRHWDWLAAQPGGASVTLRKLVEDARRASAQQDRERETCERTYRVMSAIAGDLPGCEEASRALFANDVNLFAQHIAHWPVDVRTYLQHLLASKLQQPSDPSTSLSKEA